MVSTPLKNISQNGNLSQFSEWKSKIIRNHHLVMVFRMLPTKTGSFCIPPKKKKPGYPWSQTNWTKIVYSNPTSISCFGSSINIWSAASHLLPFANVFSFDVATRSIVRRRHPPVFSAGLFFSRVQFLEFKDKIGLGKLGQKKMPKRNWLSSQIHSSWFRNLYWLT